MGKIQLIVCPYDSGHPNARMGNGPHRLLQEGLPEKLRKQKHIVQTTPLQIASGKFRTEVAVAYELMGLARQAALSSHEQGFFPIALSGNCNIAVGMISALQSHRAAPATVVWFDAHGDFNTPETTRSGYFDGMSLSVMTGRCWRALTAARLPDFQFPRDERIIHACGRDFDPEEKTALQESAIHIINTESIMNDPAQAFHAPVQVLRGDAGHTHLHVDFDALDPREAPANEYAAPHGISVAKMKESIEYLCANLNVRSASFAAYDPSSDPQNKTAEVGIDLISTLCRAVSPRPSKS